ncbi:DUF937 domain-containing protein [Rhizobium sp. Root483D2]|uniref:DUF937 domain-containing protein n=1 Tax=Rhizobium sp. Root483D2 TaxID=1736545 RepID=UPI000714C9E7|nr:DUF937 domain-containing protein [Rhizobium sp. Root483D2]KQY48781.1 hypothetical protein ASD32_00245 [Rhizobium sp. Root483D2]
MIPLFDMMMQAQNGNAMDVMAKQFGLAQEQMAKATAALMPVFSTALKRNTANPYDLSTLLAAMSNGNYAQYFEDMNKAFTPQGLADGNTALNQLFGSTDMLQAISGQAAQITGIGQEIYKQMLPVVASAIMGGLFKQASGQMGGMQNPFANTPMEAMMKPWLEASGFTRKPQPAANPFENAFTQAMSSFTPAMNSFTPGMNSFTPGINPFTPGINPFAQAMQGFFGTTKPEEKQPSAPDMFAANPFIKAFQDMMNGKPQAAPEPEKKPAEANPMAQFTEMFNSMFDSGLEAQKEYQKNIDGLFETYRKTTNG